MTQPALRSDVLISGALIMNTRRAFGEVTTGGSQKKNRGAKCPDECEGREEAPQLRTYTEKHHSIILLIEGIS